MNINSTFQFQSPRHSMKSPLFSSLHYIPDTDLIWYFHFIEFLLYLIHNILSFHGAMPWIPTDSLLLPQVVLYRQKKVFLISSSAKIEQHYITWSWGCLEAGVGLMALICGWNATLRRASDRPSDQCKTWNKSRTINHWRDWWQDIHPHFRKSETNFTGIVSMEFFNERYPLSYFV